MFEFWKVRWHIACKKSICRLHKKWFVCRIKEMRDIYVLFAEVACLSWTYENCRLYQESTNTQTGIEVMICRRSEHFIRLKKGFGRQSCFSSHHFSACARYTHSFHFKMVFLSISLRLIYAESLVSLLFICYSTNSWTMYLAVALSESFYFEYQPNHWTSWLEV
jgi:hypothetical protein